MHNTPGSPTKSLVTVSQPDLTLAEAEAAYDAVLSGRITQGARVEEFQDMFAEHIGSKYALACSSGTTALHLALLAIDAGPGDEVIVPDLSFVATANAVSYTGATPVLCDVNRDDWGLNVAEVESLIGPRTVAIVAVHLYGHACRVEELLQLANKHNLWLIEDAAEGLGGDLSPQCKLGTIGHIGTFSFYGNKVITTGEGGMLVTNDGYVHGRAYKFRGQGVSSDRRYYHDVLGFNYRMTDVQAAIGVVQMQRLDSILLGRQAVMNAYDSHLRDTLLDAGCLQESSYSLAGVAPWLYTILMPSAGCALDLQFLLAEAGYETRPVFVPMHELPMYASSRREFWVSTDLSRRGVSLPTHTGLTGADISTISSIVRSFFV